MDNLLELLYKYGAGDLIDSSRTQLLNKDTIYLKDVKDLCDLERQYENLDLTFKQRTLVNDYIACLQTVQARVSDCSYMAGIKDVILIFHSLDMLKSN